jgi:hypothetical protein
VVAACGGLRRRRGPKPHRARASSRGFNTFGAEFRKYPELSGAPADVYLAGDDAEAKKLVMDVASRGRFRPVDACPLLTASVLENLAMLWIHFATVGGQGREFTFVMKPAQSARLHPKPGEYLAVGARRGHERAGRGLACLQSGAVNVAVPLQPPGVEFDSNGASSARPHSASGVRFSS